jgi:tetratricopeptide (TPR) repeat protein
LLVAAFLAVALVGLLSRRDRGNANQSAPSGNGVPSIASTDSRNVSRRAPLRRENGSNAVATAEEIVANKVIQFGQRRRALVHDLAKHFNLEVPDEVERFFKAVESGNWEEIDAAHSVLLMPGAGLNDPRSDELHKIWRPIQETWGAAREAHDWPAQTLLEYGNAILDSLRPGMVYVGGTDPGCFIPTMLNETSDGERHIVLTQNALADGAYLDHLRFLYGNQMPMLTQDDSQRAFQEYIADAQKRLQHDTEFPDEPKQLKPGEDVKIIENRVQASGQVAVMAINEKLFQMLMEKNPGTSFAMEESFAFQSVFANATTLGPVMELRVNDEQNALTAERAAESVDYWRAISQQLTSNPETPDGSDPRKAYSKLVSSQAGLLFDRGYAAEAEEAFRIANEICPSSPEAVFRYVNLLSSQNRLVEAIPIVEKAIKAAPQERQFQDLLQRLSAAKASTVNSRP